jgi:hypothetical protein
MGPETRDERLTKGSARVLTHVRARLRSGVAVAALAVAAALPVANAAATGAPSVAPTGAPSAATGGPLSVAPGAAPTIGASVLTLPNLGPYVQFARVTYNNSSSQYDSKLQLIVVQASYAAKAYVAQLHAENPNIKVLAYQSPWIRPSSDPTGYASCLTGNGSYPANWYMTASTGVREMWTSPVTMYQMDFGNSAFLAACATHAIAMAKSIGADGVFMDGVASSIFWDQLPKKCTTVAQGASATCTSDTLWQNNMTTALGYLTAQLHAQHMLFIGNVSGGNVTGIGNGGPAVWQRFDTQMDGAMEESWTYGTNHAPLPTSEVTNGLANVAWAEAHGKYTMLNDDITNCSSCSGYGMATLMLVGQKLTSYDLSSGSYNNYSAWWASYDKGAGMGVSLGNYSTQANGLMVRRFLNGTIVVNDTTQPITDVVFGTVPAHSAIIH